MSRSFGFNSRPSADTSLFPIIDRSLIEVHTRISLKISSTRSCIWQKRGYATPRSFFNYHLMNLSISENIP
ncbi:hypothetical protein PMAYCL1PPCAC_28740 [Pristionchus mayeri]|uniref:Uncharacterized protein n=1 Tax=Pristionchus mayeri TaxID=1317129 RepID=A0AAN5IBZ4_9BILA|nr:hypothetical protein PMAYCL1PPCAC_28740 [Pristionchus mayeri]